MIVDPYFLDHWKVKAIAGFLGKDEKAPLYILRLWAYAQTSKKTTIPNHAGVVASVCCFKGHADTLLDAMIQCKVLDDNGDGTLEIHDFAEWNASLLALRKNAAKATAARLSKGQHSQQRSEQRSSLDVEQPREQRKVGLDRIGLDNTPKPPEGACAGWVSEFVSGLMATGKMPAVLADQVLLIAREFPKAELEKRWPDVVVEVSGLAAPAQNTVQVLRRAVSRIEMGATGGFREERVWTKNKEGGAPMRPDLPDCLNWGPTPQQRAADGADGGQVTS